MGNYTDNISFKYSKLYKCKKMNAHKILNDATKRFKQKI